MRAVRSVALAAVFCGVVAASAIVAGAGDAPTGDPAIPPGEEDLIASMLGRGMVLAYCTLVSGGVEYSVVKATYACPAGGIALQLAHPQNAPATSTRTGQFAITVQSGSPPPGFGEALVSLVRARENAFQWSWPQSDADAREGAVE